MIQQKILYLSSILIISSIIYLIYYKSKNNNDNNKSFDKIIMTLYRQCARWAVAAEQDDNVIIAVLHANYATGYLWAIKDITPTTDFARITGQDFLEFEKKIVSIQDAVTMRLASICKNSIPTSDKELLNAIYGKMQK